MRFKHSLRSRVSLAFAAFGGLASLTLAVGLYVASHDLEQRLIDDTLGAELEDFIARRQRNPLSRPEQTATIRAYVVPGRGQRSGVPEAVAELTPGRHQLVLGDEPFRAAVADAGGERLAVLYNESHLRRREWGFVMLLAGGVVVMALLSAVVGLWLTGRVIAPVSELAQRVSGLRPEDGPVRLAEDFPTDEVGELAENFDGYLWRLREFIERERSFTSDVSHELRTPLSVINGAAEVLLADAGLPASARRPVERIARAAREMAELTTALLVLAREEQQSAHERSRSCDAHEVLREVVDKQRALFEAKHIEVQIEILERPCVVAERAVLIIVLANLIRNAFAYTEQGHIKVCLDKDCVRVEDTGVGMSEAQVARIFDRHYRGESSRGSGIGLSLVKRICDQHGWQIRIRSQAGRGTVTELRFPPQQVQS